MIRSFMALSLTLGMLTAPQAQAQDDYLKRVYTGCDGETSAPKPSQPSTARLRERISTPEDRVRSRDFAALPITKLDNTPEEAEGLCWARLDGVWRDEAPIQQADWDGNDIWSADDRELLNVANGYYTRPNYIVIANSENPDKGLWVTDGMGGKPYVRFEAVNDSTFNDVLSGTVRAKTYQAVYPFKYGQTLTVELELTGTVRVRFDRATFRRPAPAISQMDVNNQLDINDAFIIQYQLDYLAASRRGYDIITQNPLQLIDNGKREVFARGGKQHYYIEEKKAVPIGLKFMPTDLQGMIYRKSLISSASMVQTTSAVTLGVTLESENELTDSGAYAAFDYASETMESMQESSTVGQAVAYSMAKKYALVLDHPYAMLSKPFINAVEDARQSNRYQALINKFGTHYAYAVTYGANAKMTQSISEEAYQEEASRNQSFELDAGGKLYGTGGSVRGSIASGEVSGQSGSISEEKVAFVAVGGNGSWDQNGYSAGDKPAPILLHLSPLHELLNPINFPEQPEVYVKVRNNLKRALDYYLANNASPLSTESLLPTVKPRVAEKPEKWHVYVRHTFCRDRVLPFADVEGTLTMRGYRGKAGRGDRSAPKKTFRFKCGGVKNNTQYGQRTRWSYKQGDAGIMTLTGTREEIREYIVDLDIDWKYIPNVGKRRSESKTYRQPKALRDGLAVDKKLDELWELKSGKTRPRVFLSVRMKRVQ